MRPILVLVLLAVLLLPGCVVFPPEGPKDVAGTTDGYTPTAAFLKVSVRDDGGNSTLVDFDRRDWAVSQIAKRIDERDVKFLAVHGQPREVLGEVLVQDVLQPADLAQLSYQNMHATTEQRAFYDVEYQKLLDALAPPAPSSSTPTIPSSVPSLP